MHGEMKRFVHVLKTLRACFEISSCMFFIFQAQENNFLSLLIGIYIRFLWQIVVDFSCKNTYFSLSQCQYFLLLSAYTSIKTKRYCIFNCIKFVGTR